MAHKGKPIMSTIDKRLGLTFHRTFPLKRSSVSKVITIIRSQSNENEKNISKSLFRELSSLGTVQVASMPRYAFGSGLIDDQYKLTVFGEMAVSHDPLLDQLGTQWLIHYHLSSPHGPGPAYWHELVATRFRPGDEFTQSEIIEQLNDFIKRTEGQELSSRSLEGSASAFLNTYSQNEGLGKLGLLEKVDTGRYLALQPDYPSPWVLGYALLDYWQAQYVERMAIPLESLYGERSLGGIFLIGPGRINTLLRELQEEGMVEVQRFVPPYEVMLLHREVTAMLEKLYGSVEAN